MKSKNKIATSMQMEISGLGEKSSADIVSKNNDELIDTEIVE